MFNSVIHRNSSHILEDQLLAYGLEVTELLSKILSVTTEEQFSLPPSPLSDFVAYMQDNEQAAQNMSVTLRNLCFTDKSLALIARLVIDARAMWLNKPQLDEDIFQYFEELILRISRQLRFTLYAVQRKSLDNLNKAAKASFEADLLHKTITSLTATKQYDIQSLTVKLSDTFSTISSEIDKISIIIANNLKK